MFFFLDVNSEILPYLLLLQSHHHSNGGETKHLLKNKQMLPERWLIQSIHLDNVSSTFFSFKIFRSFRVGKSFWNKSFYILIMLQIGFLLLLMTFLHKKSFRNFEKVQTGML